jgi:hypothetical protein
MWRIRLSVGLAALTLGAVSLAAPAARAANSATFRDCSFAAGFDPDFVQLSQVVVGPQGTLTVPPSQNQVRLEASESSNPGDSAGHVTLSSTVTSPQVPTHMVSGNGTGRVFLTIPLDGSQPGRSYTISWSATFDNGMHSCPSSQTPQNTSSRPFVVRVSGAATQCVVPKLKGKTLKAAKKALKAADCRLGTVRPKGQKTGKVKKQSPKAGTVLPAGSKVKVTLG